MSNTFGRAHLRLRFGNIKGWFGKPFNSKYVPSPGSFWAEDYEDGTHVTAAISRPRGLAFPPFWLLNSTRSPWGLEMAQKTPSRPTQVLTLISYDAISEVRHVPWPRWLSFKGTVKGGTCLPQKIWCFVSVKCWVYGTHLEKKMR